MPAPTLGQADAPMANQINHYRKQFLIEPFGFTIYNLKSAPNKILTKTNIDLLFDKRNNKRT